MLLAWLNSVVANLPFAGILGFTFAAGMVLFMLPPVPGPPIYLFGGLVISEHCPYGFWRLGNTFISCVFFKHYCSVFV